MRGSLIIFRVVLIFQGVGGHTSRTLLILLIQRSSSSRFASAFASLCLFLFSFFFACVLRLSAAFLFSFRASSSPPNTQSLWITTVNSRHNGPTNGQPRRLRQHSVIRSDSQSSVWFQSLSNILPRQSCDERSESS